jgi:hypothetical protein
MTSGQLGDHVGGVSSFYMGVRNGERQRNLTHHRNIG